MAVKQFSFLLAMMLVLTTLRAQQHSAFVVSELRSANSFAMRAASLPQLCYDTLDAAVVRIALEQLSNDAGLVFGQRPLVKTSPSTSPTIIAGTLGKSALLDSVIDKYKLNVNAIKGKWECFVVKVVSANTLVVAGSDPRGTAYGIFHLSVCMGVSPWVWWADAVPAKKSALYFSGEKISAEPSVKYRGIFINDEDWGLQPWAAKTFEPEVGDIGPKTYAKVFELLLRLKANLIWPAMHPSTKAFFSIPGNAQVAEDYSIVIGSSHAEPMLRNNVGEWDEKAMGHFNYLSNKSKVMDYWESRVKESSEVNAMYTVGMRGVHDGKMEGVKTSEEAVPVLEDIIKEQRQLLSKYVNKNLEQVPQVFTAYKEVLDIYDNGLKLPEDVTIIWPDDNYGYIQRLNNPAEKQRSGGSGIYYHASYWGRPHDYLWLSSTHPGLVREEMMKAYENGSKTVWVLNVGDIKPLEYNISLFMDMAWNAAPFTNAAYTREHLREWSQNIFGKNNAAAIQSITWEYYRLAFERRPEFMGWSQTEPTTKTRLTDYTSFYHGDEAQQRINQYQALENKVKQLYKSIPQKDRASFYELVYYPVVCASLMNKKFLYYDKYVRYGSQQRLSSIDYAKASQAAYDSIVGETAQYNLLLNGKWKNIMSMKPRSLPVFDPPVVDTALSDAGIVWDAKPEGATPVDSMLADGYAYRLPAIDNIYRQRRFIDIFLCKKTSLRWMATTKARWIQLSQSTGRLNAATGKKQQRLQVKIDWSLAPAATSLSDTLWFKAAGRAVPIIVAVKKFNTGNYKGFVENDGMLSFHAAHFTSHSGLSSSDWKRLPGLGYTDTVIQSLMPEPIQKEPIDTPAIAGKNAWVEYEFLSFSSAPAKVIVYSLPTHPLNDLAGMRYGVSLDNGPVKIVDFSTVGRSEEWKQNVLRNRAERSIAFPQLAPGRHHLRIYAIDPGVMIDEIRIDLGGLKPAYGSLPETRTQ